MARFITADIRGGEEVSRAIRRAARMLEPQKIKAALTAGALLVANDAKSRAPYLSGTLRRSIHVGGKTKLTPDFAAGGEVVFTDIGDSPDPRAVKVGTNVPYAARLEYGFTGEDALGRNFNQPAQPYLRPAVSSQRKAVVAEVRRVLLKFLRSVGK